jgi:hypothetical protein
MSRPMPKIMLLAKMSDITTNNFDLGILKDIQPTEIPKEFIFKVDVTFSTGKVVEFDTSRIKNNFTFDEIQEFLTEFDRKGLVRLIEITLDLAKVYKTIQQDCESIFSKKLP